MAWMVDILSGVLTGGNHGGEKVKDPFDDFSDLKILVIYFLYLNPNLFVKNYTKRIKENIKRIKKLPKLKGMLKKYIIQVKIKLKDLKKI